MKFLEVTLKCINIMEIELLLKTPKRVVLYCNIIAAILKTDVLQCRNVFAIVR